MNLARAIAAIALLAAISQTISAKEVQVIAGVGASSCGQWIEGREYKELDGMLVSWVQGFLSGMNLQRYAETKQEMAPIPDSGSLLAYIDKYCRENPLRDVAYGAVELYKEIGNTP